MTDMQDVQAQLDALRKELNAVKSTGGEDKLSLVLFSGDLDKALAAFIIATGSVAMGMDAVIFLTFWGTPLFRKPDKVVAGKDLMGKMFGWMLPKGAQKAALSKMNMGGMGTVMLKDLMRKKNVASLEQMIDMAGQRPRRDQICRAGRPGRGAAAGDPDPPGSRIRPAAAGAARLGRPAH